MCSASARELVEVVKYYRDEFDRIWQKYVEMSTEIGLALIGTGTKIMSQPGEATKPEK